MSRSCNTGERPSNPALKFFEWNGAEGHFLYYDKDAVNPDPKKKGAKVVVPLPFAFLVLDQLSIITGWSDADQSGIWSNEVRDLKKEAFTIRTKKGVECTGTYENVKGKVSGADYTKSVYIAFFDENRVLQIGNIKMSGACLNSWIEFTKGKNVNEGAIRVDTFTEAQKGTVKYKMPNFLAFTCKPETNDAAIELDKKLQEYLKEYFAYNSSLPEETATDTSSAHNRGSVDTSNDAGKNTETGSNDFGLDNRSAKEIIAEKQAATPAAPPQYEDLPF